MSEPLTREGLRRRESCTAEPAEQQTAALLRILSCVVEQTADMVLITDRSGLVEYANPAFVATTGYSQEEILGRSSSILKSGKHPAEFYRNLWETILSGRPFRATMINRKKNGELYYTEKTITPISVNAGHITHFVSTDKDVTDRELAQRRLEATAAELARSNSELETFASIASHDLQEPLRTISMYLRLIEKRDLGALAPESQEFLQFAADGAERLRNLISDLLTYAKLGTRQIKQIDFESEDCVRESLKNLSETVSANRAQVDWTVLPRIWGDPQRFTQLFQNLIGNAIKYHGSEAPRVHISAERDSQGWIFAIRDNGIGMPDAERERIFEMFHRLHSRAEFSGTGVGLAICKKIVEQRGGRIWVESRVGQGASFFFSVPDLVDQPLDGPPFAFNSN